MTDSNKAFADDLERLDRELADAQFADRLTHISSRFVAGDEAPMEDLLREIHHHDPRALERFLAQVQLARLGIARPAQAH